MKSILLTLLLPVLASAGNTYFIGYDDGLVLRKALNDDWGISTEWQFEKNACPSGYCSTGGDDSDDLYLFLRTDIELLRKLYSDDRFLVNAYLGIPFGMEREDDYDVAYDNVAGEAVPYVRDTSLATDYITGIELGMEPHVVFFGKLHVYTRFGAAFGITYSRRYDARAYVLPTTSYSDYSDEESSLTGSASIIGGRVSLCTSFAIGITF